MEEGWERRDRAVELPEGALRVAVRAFANSRPFTLEGPVQGGLVNQTFRVRLADPEDSLALRVYMRDPRAASKEAAVLARMAGRVPAPRVLHRGTIEGRPYAITTWIAGRPLAVHIDQGRPTVLRTARDAGAAIARVHEHSVDRMGLLDGALAVAEPMPGVRETFRAWLLPLLEAGRPGRCLGQVGNRLAAFVREGLDPLSAVEGRYAIVHADFKPTNVFVDEGGGLTGLLDWEFVWAGPPLIDLGQMLRWPVPDGFADALAQGYAEAGGHLLPAWRDLARTLDLLNLVTMLDTEEDRPAVTRDITRLIGESLDALTS